MSQTVTHTTTENKELFRAIKREIKAGNEEQVLGYSKVLISKIGSALAEQHEAMEDEEDGDPITWNPALVTNFVTHNSLRALKGSATMN